MRDAGLGYFSWWYSGWGLKTEAGCGNFNNQRERDFLFLWGWDARIVRENSGIREFSFILTKHLLALTEKKWFFSVYTAFVVKLWVSKEVKPVKLSLLCVVRLFWFCYFHRFRYLERGIKSLGLEVTFIKILHWSALIPVLFTDLTFSAFACRTWTILWTEGLLSKSGHGMATPALMEVDNHDNVVDIINCVALYYEKGASGNAFLPKEIFRAPVSRQVKTLKVVKETVKVSRPEF